MIEELKNRKIVFLGLGINNAKLAEYFSRQDIKFDVINAWKDPEELTEKITDYDFLIRSPGLAYTSKPIQQAILDGKTVSSQTKFFFDLCPAKIIGVTGTKGKGTTATLIASILGSAGKKAWLAGNVGKDPFEFLDQISPEDFVVLELSSFQLQDLHVSPHIAVVLNVTTDHLNHHKDLDEYIKAKSSILANQTQSDFAVLSPMLPQWFKSMGRARKVFYNPDSAKTWDRLLLGKHSLENISAAVEVCKILAINESEIKAVVAKFESLPHRINFIKQTRGISFYDDAYSTNVPPVIAAIEAVGAKFDKIILIIGGFDKDLDFSSLRPHIVANSKIKGLVVIGQVTDKILDVAHGFSGKILTGAANMREMISQAISISSPGDAILFSPGTSSFDMFKNETDRGEQFITEVNKL